MSSNRLPCLNHQRIEYMQQLMIHYDSNIRGRNPDTSCGFWDMVVITAGDDNQKSCFEHQLRQLHPVLPVGVPFRVFADPNDKVRTGCGGATLQAVHLLHKELGEELFDGMKILLIHAGGYSKRMPIHSFTNKLFASLPVSMGSVSSEPYTMLDMKLLMYLPFVGLMTNGGIFSVTADDLEGFCIRDGGLEVIQRELDSHKDVPYLCAMAHPAPIDMGTRHGVYKLNEADRLRVERDVARQFPSARLIIDCPEVLQKVGEARLREKGMVLSAKLGEDEQEFVLTDSTYWINPCLMRKFLQFYDDQTKPIACETSIYADFITCQGRDLHGDYITKVLTADPQSTKATRFKYEVCLMMREVPLFVLVLPASTYNDLGTLPEYIDAVCGVDEQLGREMGFTRIVSTKFGNSTSPKVENVEGVVISSLMLDPDQRVPERVVIENCRFERGQVKLAENTILSGCHVVPSTIKGRSIPGGYIYHTVPIKEGDKDMYVTIVFHISDDLKSPCSTAAELNVGPVHVSSMFKEAVTASDLTGGGEMTLWNVRIFPAMDTRGKSFSKSVEIIIGGKVDLWDSRRYSMTDLVRAVDNGALLDREFVRA